jgi:ATP-binding cassette subfamily B protein
MREVLFAHILRLDHGYFLNTRPGEVMSRLTTDLAVIETLVGASVSVALRNVMILLGSIGILMWVSASLTGLVIVLLALVMAPLFIFGKRVRELTIDAQDRFAEAVGYAGETFDALDTVQAFGREKMVAGRFAALVENSFRASQARVRARSIMTAMVVGLVFMGIVGVLWLGSRWVLGGAMTGGALAQFFLLSVIAAGAVGSLGESWGEVQRASGAMQRIAELLSAEPEIKAPAGPRPLPLPGAWRGGVRERHLLLSRPSRPAGPARLLAAGSPGRDRGARRPVRGGQEHRVAAPAALLRSPGRQRAPGRRRPAGGGPGRGARAPGAGGSGRRPALGLGLGEHPLRARGRQRRGGPRGRAPGGGAAVPRSPASGARDPPRRPRQDPLGGQRQRLAISRAFVRDAPVLLLDEATSALDAESERLVQHAIEEAMANRTTLVIAHRLATVLRADRIVVIDQGAVAEEGTHAELTARGGLYARLAQLQFGAAA